MTVRVQTCPWFPRLRNRPMRLIWPFLTLCFAFVTLLIVIKQLVREEDAVDRRWIVSPNAWRMSRSPAALLTGYSSVIMFPAAVYSEGKKRRPALAVALYCSLAAYTFLLQYFGLLHRPKTLDLGFHTLVVAATPVGVYVASSLLALKVGSTAANALVVHPAVLRVTFWVFLWPIPRLIIKMTASNSITVPLAATMCLLLIGVQSWLGFKATKTIGRLLTLHWTVIASAACVFLCWCTSEVFYVLIAFGVPGVTADTAAYSNVALIVLQCLFLNLFVAQTVLNFEESARLRTERDSAKSALAVATRVQEQIAQAEESRQKFLRYVFHEIRVPFNSIDMGLGMLLEDISAASRLSELSGSMRKVVGDSAPAHGGQGPLGGVWLSEDARATVEIMAKAADSMKVIINDTLDWTKLQAGSFQMMLGATCVADVVAGTVVGLSTFAMHPDNNVKVQSHIDPALPKWMLADKERLQQVVANLVCNAVKFAPHNGPGLVTVCVYAVEGGLELSEEDRGGFPRFDGKGVWWKQRPATEAVAQSGAGSAADGGGGREAGGEGSGAGQGSSYLSIVGHMSEREAPAALPAELSVDAGFRSRGRALLNAVFGATTSTHILASQEGGTAQPAPHSAAEAGTGLPPRAEPRHAVVATPSATSSLPHIEPPAFPTDLRIKLMLEGFHLRSASASAASRPHSAATASMLRSRGYSHSAHASAAGDQLCTIVISVKDNGAGVSPHDAPALFRAFRQLEAGMQYKGKGTGLGLAICHEIVSLHGGIVGVRSSGKEGEGAEFLVALTLPVLHRDAAGAAAASKRSIASSPCNTPYQEILQAQRTLSVRVLAADDAQRMSRGGSYSSTPALPALPPLGLGSPGIPPLHAAIPTRAGRAGSAFPPGGTVYGPASDGSSASKLHSSEYSGKNSSSGAEGGQGVVSNASPPGPGPTLHTGAYLLNRLTEEQLSPARSMASGTGSKASYHARVVRGLAGEGRGSEGEGPGERDGHAAHELRTHNVQQAMIHRAAAAALLHSEARDNPDALMPPSSYTPVGAAGRLTGGAWASPRQAAAVLQRQPTSPTRLHGRSMSAWGGVSTPTSPLQRRHSLPLEMSFPPSVTTSTPQAAGGIMGRMTDAPLDSARVRQDPTSVLTRTEPMLPSPAATSCTADPSYPTVFSAPGSTYVREAHQAPVDVLAVSSPRDQQQGHRQDHTVPSQHAVEVVAAEAQAEEQRAQEEQEEADVVTIPVIPLMPFYSEASRETSGDTAGAGAGCGPGSRPESASSAAPRTLTSGGKERLIVRPSPIIAAATGSLLPPRHIQAAPAHTLAVNTQVQAPSPRTGVPSAFPDGGPRPSPPHGHSLALSTPTQNTGTQTHQSAELQAVRARLQSASGRITVGQSAVNIQGPLSADPQHVDASDTSPRPVHVSPSSLLHHGPSEAGRRSGGTRRVIRILVVDDVADNRKLLVRALKRKLESALAQHAAREGQAAPVVQISEAEDGDVAVDKVSAATATGSASQQYDVITMDAEMPRMPGFTATQILRTAGFQGAIYGCTGNALQEDQALFRSCGANDVFIKPLNVGALADAIVTALPPLR